MDNPARHRTVDTIRYGHWILENGRFHPVRTSRPFEHDDRRCVIVTDNCTYIRSWNDTLPVTNKMMAIAWNTQNV